MRTTLFFILMVCSGASVIASHAGDKAEVAPERLSKRSFLERSENLLKRYQSIPPGSRGLLALRDPAELRIVSANLGEHCKAFLEIYDKYEFSYIIVMYAPQMKGKNPPASASEPKAFWKGALGDYCETNNHR